MGVELKITDRELPSSPAFVNFIAQLLDGRPFEDRPWPDQRSESLNHALPALREQAVAEAPRVIGDGRGRVLIARAYSLFVALMTGDLPVLHAVQHHLHFMCVVGIPRSGGSYLTAELFRSLGHSPESVPAALAHDGFPEAAPFELRQDLNGWISSLHTMAEYLTMVEVFFAMDRRRGGKVVVPKKLTKGIYAGAFFHRVLGETTEHFMTVRHPVAACISTYEKSGGLPADGRFAIRSNIEEWCHRDLRFTGRTDAEIQGMDYFDAYLRYWEHYHLLVSTTGLSASRHLRVVPYGVDTMESLAAEFHQRHQSGLAPAPFFPAGDAAQRHPDWMKRAAPAIKRVASAWAQVGLDLPSKALMQAL